MENTESKAHAPSDQINALIDSFTLMDDSFMTTFFDSNHEATIFLDRDDIKVGKVQVQKKEKSPLKEGRDVVLDIYAVDSDGRHYDIEIQREDSGAGRKRARFHSSVIDSRMLKSGD